MRKHFKDNYKITKKTYKIKSFPYEYNANKDYLYFFEHRSKFDTGIYAIQNGAIIGKANSIKALILSLNPKYKLGTYFIIQLYKNLDVEYPVIDFDSKNPFFKGFYLK